MPSETTEYLAELDDVDADPLANGLDEVPGVGYLLDAGNVEFESEEWHEDPAEVTLTWRIEFETSGDLADFGEFSLGIDATEDSETLTPVRLHLPGPPIRLLLVALSYEEEVNDVDEDDVHEAIEGTIEWLIAQAEDEPLDDDEEAAQDTLEEFDEDLENDVEIEVDDLDPVVDAVTALFERFGDASGTAGPVDGWIQLSADWLTPAKRLTDDSETVVDIVPKESSDAEARLTVTGAELVVSRAGLYVDAETDVDLSIPPVIVADSEVALEFDSITGHLDGEIPNAAETLDRSDDWTGVVIEKGRAWGLDRLLPFGDGDDLDHVEIEDWLIEPDGMTGSLDAPVDADAGAVSVERATLEFDRTWWPVGLTLETVVAIEEIPLLDGLIGDDATEHTVTLIADLRVDPHADDPADRWRLDLTFEGDGAASEPLLGVGESALDDIGVACGSLAGAATLAGEDPPDVAVLLGVLAALDTRELVDWNGLVIDGVSGVVYHEAVATIDGQERTVPRADLDVDLRLDVELDVDADAGDSKSVPLELSHPELTSTLTLDDDIDSLDVPQLEIPWEATDDLGITLPGTVDLGGPLTVTNVTAARDGDNFRLEFGVDASGSDDVAVEGLPDVIVISLDTGDVSDMSDLDDLKSAISVSAERRGQGMTLFVPGVLYAKGSMERGGGGDTIVGDEEWEDVLRGELRAYLIADDPGLSTDALKSDDAYLFDLDVELLSATRKDGLQAFVLTLDAGFEPGLPIGSSGAAVYGFGLTYAQNGRPDVVDNDYGEWFLKTPEEYSTGASKWKPEAGHWGFGASATVGSLPDAGISWNVSAGLFLLLPGPTILITGEGDLFKPPSGPPDDEEVEGAFAAIIALDFLHNEFSLDLDAEMEISEAGQELVSVSVPARVWADLENPRNFEVALGRPSPESDRMHADIMGLYEASAYFFARGDEITEPDALPTLPGLAFAFGAAARWERGIDADPVTILLWVQVGFDVGASLSLPLFAGRVWAEGGIDVTVYGIGLSLSARLTLTGIAPEPFLLTGEIEVVLELSWPLPDVDVTADLTIGDGDPWLDGGPDPELPVTSLTLWGRGSEAPQVLEVPEDYDEDEDSPIEWDEKVPLDAVPELVFSVPVGNEDTDLGSVSVDGDDSGSEVWEVATTGENDDGEEERLGYRHVIDTIDIEPESDTYSDVSAVWPQGTETGNTGVDPGDDESEGPDFTAGGQVDRSVLTFDPIAEPVEGRVGSGADRLSDRLDSWTPCDQPDREDVAAVRRYTMRSHGDHLDATAYRPPPIERPPRRRRPLGGRDLPEIEPDPDHGMRGQTWAHLDPVVMTDPAVVAGERDETRQNGSVEELAEQPGTLPLVRRRDLGAVPLEAGTVHELPDELEPIDDPAGLWIEEGAGSPNLWQGVGAGMNAEPARLGQNPADEEHGPVRLASTDPVLGLPRLLLETAELPAADEFSDRLPGVQKLNLAGLATLVDGVVGRAAIDLPYSDRATAGLLLAPGVIPAVWAVNPDGTETFLEADAMTATDLPLAIDGGIQPWQFVRVSVDEPVVGLRLAAVQGITPELRPDRQPVAASLVWVESRYTNEAAIEAATRSREATADAFEKELEKRDAWTDGEAEGMLAPDETYTLTVTGSSYRAREAPGTEGLETAGEDDWSISFRFETTESPPDALTPHPDRAVPIADSDDEEDRLSDEDGIDNQWEVATAPADGATAHYYADDPLVRLRDSRLLAVFEAFDRELVIRLADDRGEVIEPDVEPEFRIATDLLPTEAVLRERLRDDDMDCLLPEYATPADLWQEVRFPFDSEVDLEPGRRYVASIHDVAEGEPISDPDESLYEWRFETSRWAGLSEHLDAHEPVSEAVPVDGDGFQGIWEALADADIETGSDVTVDGTAVDEWLFDTLGLPPRDPPAEPEIITVWAWHHATNATAPAAIAFDGPEPLLRGAEPSVTVAGAGTDVRVLTDNARARVLLLPGDPADPSEPIDPDGSEDPWFPTDTELTVTIESAGVKASKTLEIPSGPEVWSSEVIQ